jgi:sulfur carrier protein
LKIRLNGEPVDIAGPLTIAALLAHYDIDARRVAVEHNLVVVKRAGYDATTLSEGDEVEIVNFVGGGSPRAHPSPLRLAPLAQGRPSPEPRAPSPESRVPR